MKKNIAICIGLFLLISCNSNIPASKMTDILIDISLAVNHVQQQIVDQKIEDTNIRKNMQLRALDTVCAIHKISQKELKDNYNYYINHPSEMKIILDSMHQRINRLLQSNSK